MLVDLVEIPHPQHSAILTSGIRLSSKATRYSSDKNPDASLRTLPLLTCLSVFPYIPSCVFPVESCVFNIQNRHESSAG